MGGDNSTGDGKSVRKRLAASIKRVMSIGKRDGGTSASKEKSVAEPVPVAIPAATANATPTATTPVIVAPPIGCVAVLNPRWSCVI